MLLNEAMFILSQTDQQVVASGLKLNFCRKLCWVAKQPRKFPPKYMKVIQKTS